MDGVLLSVITVIPGAHGAIKKRESAGSTASVDSVSRRETDQTDNEVRTAPIIYNLSKNHGNLKRFC